MFTREQAKVTLKDRGWSYRTAAPLLGISYQHLCWVLNGQRSSRRVLKKIELIPARQQASPVPKKKGKK